MKITKGSIILLASASSCHAKAFRGTSRKLQSMTAINDFYTIIEGNELKDKDPGFLDNDIASGDIFMSSYTEVGSFRGNLKVYSDGEIKYKPEDGFVGAESFVYTACLVDQTNVCDVAVVTITVQEDTNRPDEDPTAVDDEYTVTEGETLTISASDGFLDNDSSGSPESTMIVCDMRDSVDDGDLDEDKDGSFEYTAPKCFEGDVTFRYKACYEDYKEMESDWATVTITVEASDDRPDTPDANDDSYTVREAETLDVSSRSGLLNNDDLFLKNVEKSSGFVGDLNVDSDGSFTYTAISGQQGSFEFTYEACVKDWDDCVDCSEATVTIKVIPNPNKPDTPPSTSDRLIETLTGDRLRENLFGDIETDDRYTLFASDYETGSGFIGILNTNDDGSFEYGNAPAGNDTFVYTVCYEEWPDVCADGAVTVSTMWSLSSGISARAEDSVPMLELVGNDLDPTSAFPLSQCQGDCDSDADCEGALICMERKATEVIPGCIGNGNTFNGRDFCIQATEDSLVRDGSGVLDVVGDADGEPHPFYPLLECEADCDSDSECSGDLICFHRSNMEPVPGCVGDQEAFEGRDFCVQP